LPFFRVQLQRVQLQNNYTLTLNNQLESSISVRLMINIFIFFWLLYSFFIKALH